MIFLPHQSDQSQCIFEVAGDQDDPMTKKRTEIFEPIAKEISNKMETICGSGTGQPKPYSLQKETQIIKSEIMPCNKCGATTAMMIIASKAYTSDQLEDYARFMFSKVKEIDVPTWIVGEEKEVVIGGQLAGEALVLKIWPTREPAKIIPSTELNPIFNQLMDNHC